MKTMITSSDNLACEIKMYYEKSMSRMITDEIYNKLKEQAKKFADEIVAQYDFKQYYKIEAGDKLIITSVFSKKKGKT